MKKLVILTALLLGVMTLSAQQRRKSPAPITAETNVMSFNIRYDTPNDGINRWDNRKEKVVQTILEHEADIVGLQEVVHHQLMYLAEKLPNYDWMGVGRDDGIEKGEYSPIFYNKNKFTEVGSGYFWLSESPMEAGSVGWDAAITRVATWAKLKDNRTGTIVFVLNTHFDHIGKTARLESAKLLMQKIYAYTKKEQYPIVVTGDFNAEPDTDVYKTITDTSNPYHLIDAYSIASWKQSPGWSFHEFGKMPVNERPLIDYVFVKNNVSVLEYSVLAEKEGLDVYASDHSAVVVKVQF